MSLVAENRLARAKYHLLEFFETGIELRGTEVKSIRAGGAQLREAFVRVEGREMFLWNAHISPYEQGNRANHDPTRKRRLLMHRREILRMGQKAKEKGLTIVLLKLYLKKGRIKCEIALAKGKDAPDRRQEIKKRIDDREARAALRGGRRG